MTPPNCELHPTVQLQCPACNGAIGGKATTPAKRASSQRNIAKRWEKRAAERAREK